jgi:beta-glucosidase
VRHRAIWAALAGALRFCFTPPIAIAEPPVSPVPGAFPWDDRTLSPDRRADLVLQRMTLDEKIRMVHGAGMIGMSETEPAIVRSNGGGGFVPGIRRLGIPDLNMSDSAVGVAGSAEEGRYATALPSALALASSWDERLAFQYGSLIGAELADQGFNVSLGGGVNLARDPRDGRIFEFLGEDPILAGNMVARIIDGVQSHHIIGDVKHFAANDQETGRMFADAHIATRALRETDLLAFRIAVRQAHPGMVMCAYNLVNGVYSCQDPYLLTQVLRKEWGFKGWVISDWGGAHSTARAALAGLDMEMPGDEYFGDGLERAVEDGRVPASRLDEMVHRILRTEFASGIIDHPPQRAVPDIFRGFATAQRTEEESAVLLKNSGILPLDAHTVTSIVVIGSHADAGVLSGGGSSQVSAPGGNAVHYAMPPPGDMLARLSIPVWDPSAPLRAIRAEAPGIRTRYDPGTDPVEAAAAARAAQIAIVFVRQHMMEGVDAPSLALPGNQNQLVAAVSAANPRTIVVLETGGPVAMPWAGAVAGILEAWYPGIRGGQAIADLLFGAANPSGKLPVTFPRDDAQLPRPVIPAPPVATAQPTPDRFGEFGHLPPPFAVRYPEGLEVGYKWFDAEHEQPLFPFGFGLSYSTFAYSNLQARWHDDALSVSFSLRNTSSRAGTEIAEAYLTFPGGTGEPPKRLIGWVRVALAAGQGRTVSLRIDPLNLSIFDARDSRWRIFPGRYTVLVGSSALDLPLAVAVRAPEH